jgi:hypothetical protein
MMAEFVQACNQLTWPAAIFLSFVVIGAVAVLLEFIRS